MTTIKQQVFAVLKSTGEKPEDLRCFTITCHEGRDCYYTDDSCTPPEEVAFNDLTDREYDDGYGGVEGPPFIAFGEKYIYIRGEYDGCEWIQAIPRHAKYLGKTLPSIGGS